MPGCEAEEGDDDDDEDELMDCEPFGSGRCRVLVVHLKGQRSGVLFQDAQAQAGVSEKEAVATCAGASRQAAPRLSKGLVVSGPAQVLDSVTDNPSATRSILRVISSNLDRPRPRPQGCSAWSSAVGT